MSFTSTSAGATGVSYTVDFKLTNGIAADGSVTVAGSSRTSFNGSSGCLTDLTNAGDSDGCVSGSNQNGTNPNTTDNGSVITFGVSNAAAAGDSMSLVVNGVTNPETSTQVISVATSADPAPSASAAYPLSAQTSVGQPTVSFTSTSAGATGVSYTVDFKLTNGIAADGSVTVAGSSGTSFNGSSGCLTDLTNAGDSDGCVSGSNQNGTNPNTTDNGSVITFGVTNAAAAGDSMSLVVNGVTNPETSTQVISVATSADPAPSASAAYPLSGSAGGLTSVSKPGLSVTSSAGGAMGVTYTLSFKTSAAGQLVGGDSLIDVVAPSGTFFPSCDHYDGCAFSNNYHVVDNTTGSGTAVATQNSVNDNGASVSLEVANTVDAGDSVTVTIAGVTNAPAGASSVELSTSADAKALTVPFTSPLSGPNRIHSPSLTPSATAGGATGVTYALSFTASATGQLVGGNSLVNIVAPAGTFFPSCDHYDGCGFSNNYHVVDHTTGSGTAVATQNSVNDNGASVSLDVANTN